MRVWRSFSTTREVFEAVGVWLGSLYSPSPYFLAGPVWWGLEYGGQGTGGVSSWWWPRALLGAKAPRCWRPGTCQRMPVPRSGRRLRAWSRAWAGMRARCPPRAGTARGPRTQDRRHGDPDSELRNSLLWLEWGGGGQRRDRGGGRIVTQLAFLALRLLGFYLAYLGGVRREGKTMKVRNVKCLWACTWIALGAAMFVFSFACHSVPALHRGEGARWGTDTGD